MQHRAVIVGLGQLGQLFGAGLLACGYTVMPVRRHDNMAAAADVWPDPTVVLIATGEGDLAAVLQDLPAPWRESIALLQNELLPYQWQERGIVNPTVLPVWFEKKPGKVAIPLLPTPVYGPASDLFVDVLTKQGLPARKLSDAESLQFELVLKNMYILTTNIAGLRVGGTVGELWSVHRSFAEKVFAEVLRLQEALTGVSCSRDALMGGFAAAVAGDPEHQCCGRSAPIRLERALRQSERLGVELPLLTEIAGNL